MSTTVSVPVAPLARRVVAVLIDALTAAVLVAVLSVLAVVVIAVSGGATDPARALAAMAVAMPLIGLVNIGWLIVYTLMQAGAGSLGMRTQGIRLVREGDSAPLGFGKALLRNVIFGLSCSIVVGYFTVLFDTSGRGQGWHDKVAGALMVDARAAFPSAAITHAAPPAPEETVLAAPAVPSIPVPPVPPAAPFSAPPVPPAVVSAPPPPPAAPPVPPAAPPVPAPAAAPAPPPAVVPSAGEGIISFVPGVTQDAPPARDLPDSPAVPRVEAPPAEAPLEPAEAPLDASQAPAVPPPAAAFEDPDDDLEATRISIPGHRLVFTWDDGTRVEVSRRAVFGRNPAPDADAVLVSVRDETLSLSKTHFEAGAEPSGGWVMDRRSTNGVIIVRDGERIACPPGEKVRVRLGDALEIGERIVTIGGYA